MIIDFDYFLSVMNFPDSTGTTRIIFLPVGLSNNEGVFEATTIRSGLNFFYKVEIVVFIILFNWRTVFVPYG